MVECCLDALAVVQEAGDLVAVVAAGSTTGGRLERWIGRLSLASLVLIGFNADEGGDTAAAWWLRALRERGKRWRPAGMIRTPCCRPAPTYGRGFGKGSP
jgi:hypothetical protein